MFSQILRKNRKFFWTSIFVLIVIESLILYFQISKFPAIDWEASPTIVLEREDHGEYIEGILERGKETSQITIFNIRDNYSMRKIQKTMDIYEPLLGLELSDSSYKGIGFATKDNTINIFIIVFLLLMSFQIFINDKEKGYENLTFTMKNGRKALTIEKIKIFLLYSIVATILFVILQYLFGIVLLQVDSLKAPIQNVEVFFESYLNISIIQFLFIYLGWKILFTMFLGLGFCMIIAISEDRNRSTLILFCFMIFQYVLYSIKVTKQFSLLYFGNNILWKSLEFVNCFGKPIILPIFLIVLLIIIGSFSLISSIYISGLIRESKKSKRKIKAGKKQEMKSLFYYEWYKLYFGNKFIFLVILLMVFQVFYYSVREDYLEEQEFYYKEYMGRLSGYYTSETVDFLKQETKRIEALKMERQTLSDRADESRLEPIEQGRLMEVQELLRVESGFLLAKERIEYIKNNKKHDYIILDDIGYKRLFKGSFTDKAIDLFGSLSILLIGAVTVFREDRNKKLDKFFDVFKNRDSLKKAKRNLLYFNALILFILGIFPRIIQIGVKYSYNNVLAKSGSLPYLIFSSNIPIAIYIMALISICLGIYIGISYIIYRINID